MKNFFYFICIFVLASCSHYSYENNSMNELDKALIKAVANEVAISNNILYKSFLYSPGDGFVFLICFDSYENLNISQARQLYINLMEQFLKNIHNQGMNYLTFENTNIRLKLIEDNGRIHKDESLTFVDNNEKYITYYFNYNQTDRLKPMHTESFEEAIRIVNNEKEVKTTVETRDNDIKNLNDKQP